MNEPWIYLWIFIVCILLVLLIVVLTPPADYYHRKWVKYWKEKV